MVAGHDWDLAGAQAVGMRTAYLTRGSRDPLPDWPAPDVIALDLAQAIAAELPG